jgi:CRP-like cAMP-binding protein
MDWQWLETQIFERPLSQDERFTLQAVIQQVEFAKGDRILVQDEPGDTLYLLRSGTVAVELDCGGEHVHLTELGEGAQLGDLSFIDEQKTGATLIARTPCTAYKLTRYDLSRLYSYREDIAHELLVHTLKGMSHTIRAMNETQAAALRYIRGQHH